MGLLLEQPRGPAPLPAPRAPSEGCAIIWCEVEESKIQRKRVVTEARENKGCVCTKEVWGYCKLTNEINAGGYLYLPWYSKGNLGSVCVVAD